MREGRRGQGERIFTASRGNFKECSGADALPLTGEEKIKNRGPYWVRIISKVRKPVQ